MNIADPKIQTMLGMLARLVPKEEYAKLAAAIDQLVQLGTSLDTRLKAIEAHVARAGQLAERLALLESVVLANVPGAKDAYAEQAQWSPDKIEKALAPAVTGELQREH